MSIAASSIVSDFLIDYKGATSAMAYSYINQADLIIQRTFRLNQQWLAYALEAYEEEIVLVDNIVWIRQARYCTKPNTTPNKGRPGNPIDLDNEDSLDTGGVDFRKVSPGDVRKGYQSHDASGGTLGITPPADDSTLTVTAATNASPIVITSSAAHGLADGDRVDIYGALINTAANGEWYAKRTGYSTTSFGLYSDSDLATPVAGNGVYTTGGLILCEDSPLLLLKAAYHVDIDASTTLPDSPILKSMYLNGMKRLHAEVFDKKNVGLYEELFDKRLAEQDALTHRRAGFKHRQMRIVGARSSIEVAQTRF